MSDVSQGEGWWIASNGKWYPPERTPGHAPPPPPPDDLPAPPSSPSNAAVPGGVPPDLLRAGPWLIMAAAGLAVLGSVLPWASVTSAFGSIDVAGTNGDGKITLFLALAVGALGLWLAFTSSDRSLSTVLCLLVVAGAAVTAAIAAADMRNVQDKIDSVNSTQLATASVGVGLWITLLGAGGCGVAGLLLLYGRRKALA